MNKQTKTEQLSQRQQDAIQTATENEKQAAKRLAKSFRQITLFGFTFELWSAKARQKWEQAQAQRIGLQRKYGAILQAVCIDYAEQNTIKAN